MKKLIIVGFLVFFCLSSHSVQALSIKSNFDGVDKYGSISGWVYDEDNHGTVFDVRIFVDAPGWAGQEVGRVVANQKRKDLNDQGVSGNHGFLLPLPFAYKDGQQYRLHAEAFVQGTYQPLSQSPFLFKDTSPLLGVINEFSDGYSIKGWAANKSNQSETQTVFFFVDGPNEFSGGRWLGSTIADLPDFNINQNDWILGNHGYSFKIPQEFLDGKIHTIYAGAQSPDKNISPAWLNNSGKQFAFKVARSAPDVAHLIRSTGDTSLKVEAIGPTETVYSWAKDRCEDADFPDASVVAFRNHVGEITLLASNDINRTMSGSSFYSLKRNCEPVFVSRKDNDFDKLKAYEWITGTFTNDGKTVYALVHNEWYGWMKYPSKCKRYNGVAYSITSAQSSDGGKTFNSQQDYIVRRPGFPWLPDFKCGDDGVTWYGSSGSSNIIKKEDYYYSFFAHIPTPMREAGTSGYPGVCLLRTNNLTAGSAWEVYAKDGWKSGYDGNCDFINEGDFELIYSVTYNTYLKAYLAIGYKWRGGTPGVYYSTSKDLVAWSPSKLLMPMDSNIRVGYLSIIDHDDTSLSFENSGKEPHLYMVYYFDSWEAYNRDIIRQKIRLTKLVQEENQHQTTLFSTTTTKTKDIIRPTPPSNLSAFPISSSQVNLSWGPSTDNIEIAGYRVYRGGSVVATLGNQTNYQMNNLSPATLYTFSVESFDLEGNVSLMSNSASVLTKSGPVGISKNQPDTINRPNAYTVQAPNANPSSHNSPVLKKTSTTTSAKAVPATTTVQSKTTNKEDSKCVSFRYNLAIRSQDKYTKGEVTLLQKFLYPKYLTVSPTGYFGQATMNAVRGFQKDNMISATGYVGPQTRAVIKQKTCK